MGETEGYRIDASTHHDGDRRGRAGGCSRARCGVGHYDIDRQARQFLSQLRKGGEIAVSEAVFEDNVAALDITKLAHPPTKRLKYPRRLVRGGRQNPAARNLGLLRAEGAPRRHHSAQQQHQLATFHSMTSSARARIEGEFRGREPRSPSLSATRIVDSVIVKG